MSSLVPDETESLLLQIHPQHVIVNNRQSSDFKSVIRELCGNIKNANDEQEEVIDPLL